MKVHFLVYDVQAMANDKVRIGGIVDLGKIRVGQIFTDGLMLETNLNKDSNQEAFTFYAVVKGILAYRREIDELPEGMSGDLIVEGNGLNKIVHNLLIRSVEEKALIN